VNQHFLLIASRDPYGHGGTRSCYRLAEQLAGEGHRVTLFLVQNGVLPARPSPVAGELQALVRAGVRVAADEFSLRERGIDGRQLAAGVEPASLELVIDALAQGAKAVWH
jgi:sulfur relay (sulfurtransferase) complex TusBCD TusD component (DsrE family)